MKQKTYKVASVSVFTDEDGNQQTFVRSTTEIEALSEALALEKARSMTLFERKRRGFDPTAGNQLIILKKDKPEPPATDPGAGAAAKQGEAGQNPPSGNAANAAPADKSAATPAAKTKRKPGPKPGSKNKKSAHKPAAK